MLLEEWDFQRQLPDTINGFRGYLINAHSCKTQTSQTKHLKQQWGQVVFPDPITWNQPNPTTTPECQKQNPGFSSSIRQISTLLNPSTCTRHITLNGVGPTLSTAARARALTPSRPDAQCAFKGKTRPNLTLPRR